MLSRLLFLLVALAACTAATAQLLSQPAGSAAAPAESESVTVRFRVGAIVTAKRGACRDIQAMVAVPIECDEQSVRLVESDFSPEVAGVQMRDLAGGNARQMLISIPYLKAGAEARAMQVYEVTTRTTPPPSEEEAARYAIPKRPPRKLRGYLGPSPFIESKHPKLRKLARSLNEEEGATAGATNDWERLELLYEHVLDTIEYVEGPDTSALTTLKEGSADCHGRSALFVALCRANKTPARMVWVNEHCYPEFYLQDSESEEKDAGKWFPAESAGTRAFGEMPIARVIMQKGDDFRVPGIKGRLRYVTDQITGKKVSGGGEPKPKYVREVVAILDQPRDSGAE